MRIFYEFFASFLKRVFIEKILKNEKIARKHQKAKNIIRTKLNAKFISTSNFTSIMPIGSIVKLRILPNNSAIEQ